MFASRPALLVALMVVGCNAGTDPAPPASEPGAASHASTVHTDRVIGCRFAVPEPGLRAAAEHFEPSSPPSKLKHSIVLSTPLAPVVRIDVWNNSERLALQDWFDRYLAFSLASGATAERAVAGRSGHEAIVVYQPRSPQSQARRITTFLAGDRVFRVTCVDGDDAAHLQVWQRIVDTFETGVQP